MTASKIDAILGGGITFLLNSFTLWILSPRSPQRRIGCIFFPKRLLSFSVHLFLFSSFFVCFFFFPKGWLSLIPYSLLSPGAGSCSLHFQPIWWPVTTDDLYSTSSILPFFRDDFLFFKTRFSPDKTSFSFDTRSERHLFLRTRPSLIERRPRSLRSKPTPMLQQTR